MQTFLQLHLAHYLGIVPDTRATADSTPTAARNPSAAAAQNPLPPRQNVPLSNNDNGQILQQLQAKADSGQGLTNEELKQLLAMQSSANGGTSAPGGASASNGTATPSGSRP